MNTLRPLALLLIFLLVLAGCTSQLTPTFQVDQKPGVDLAAYRTFTIVPMTEPVPGADPSVVKAGLPVVMKAIQTDLVAKGYREVSFETEKGQADFAVVLNATVLPQINARDTGYIPGYVGSDWYGSYTEFKSATSVHVDTYEQGTIALQIYDAKTREMVWVGFGTAMKNDRDSPADRIGRVAAGVREMLTNFPAARTAAAN